MNVQNTRWLLATIFVLVVAAGCSPSASLPSSRSAPTATPPPPMSLRTPASQPSIDYVTLEAEIEKAITAGPATLDKVRAVLVNVDGETKIAHYRHGFTEDDHGHVFSVTKSVLSILIGIAIEDDLIADIDQPLVELLPKHRDAMSSDTAKVTLRHLMTMSGGFNPEFPNGGLVWEKAAEPGSSLVDLLLRQRKDFEPGKAFWYSDTSAHLVATVLAAALERADGNHPRTVLDYARQKLFNPLGISTHPSFSQALPDLFAAEFVTAGFGWGTDPNDIHLGGYGLRLTAPDMMKIGELYRSHGVWNGEQIVPSAWIQQCTSASTFETKIGDIGDNEYGLLWWIIGQAERAGYFAAGFGGQRIVVLPKSRAVIVYLSDVQPDSQIDRRDLKSLDRVFISAFPQ